jgi:hypothetical protein
MILTTLEDVSAADVADRTGWAAQSQGMCRGEVCVPAPGALRADGTVDIHALSIRLGMPLLHDETHGVWALGPATATGRALSTAVAADPQLIDRGGNPFRLSSLHGRKVLLVAWSSY